MAQGHDFHQVFDGYPATVVKGLLSASRLQRRYRLAEQVMALSAAVTGALDLAFNEGRGKILEKWIGEVLPDKMSSNLKQRPKMSERAFSFFLSLPRRGHNGDG